MSKVGFNTFKRVKALTFVSAFFEQANKIFDKRQCLKNYLNPPRMIQ